MTKNNKQTRIEKDSMGEVQVPLDALYGAQTQRAIDNFPISGLAIPNALIRALGLIKHSAAVANQTLGLLDAERSNAIQAAAQEVIDGKHNSQFPIDIFQTGSGTSSNMNANEVIAAIANKKISNNNNKIHPNDHVNMGQSSNDVFPTAIHISACLQLETHLLPSLRYLSETLNNKAQQTKDIVKTGRTHLMDAMPVTFGQEISAWAAQIQHNQYRIQATLTRIRALVQGGTAVGTGINAHPEFAEKFVAALNLLTDFKFTNMDNLFVGLASQDSAVELSGQLKTLAVSIMKISNDLRWMNSGPLAGLGEIALPALQPGSSIMPGKVNPVIPEAVAMVCAQVIGNDSAICIGGQSGNFQLNVMLPMIAYNLLNSIILLGNASRLLADKAIKDFTVNNDNLSQALNRNPILVTALNSVIGYEKGAAIAKKAYAEQRTVIDVALEMTDLSQEELVKLLDPEKLTKGGI
ncbi:Fumarate hydratase class II [hydrothermal vent metagenome]|uniref:fumarate hydratase n=1 Tax=hydrothermal vent metagenome TaxID=652676 RepID=A0A3B1AXP7_9ZZZZ